MLAKIIRHIIPERFRPIGYLTHLSRQQTNCTVIQGPFKGMRYVQVAHGSAYIPKLIGIYERELNPLIDEIIKKSPDVIVDIGAAEGYYAVGLALSLKHTRIIAFEMEANGRVALTKMAELNNVKEFLDVRGKCEVTDLESVLENASIPVVICDVEGYEEVLLDKVRVPSLSRSVILVEMHDFIIPEITETIKKRFADSHNITHLWQEPRSSSDFPWHTFITRLLPQAYLNWAVSEWRPVRMAWLYMVPLSIYQK